MDEEQGNLPPPPDIARKQWWKLPSGATVEVCRVQYSEEDGAYIATVRRLDENNTMSLGSFDVVASLITTRGVKVER